MGSSGEGKTVFLQHIIGLLKPDSGSVIIDGVDITKLPENELLKIRRNFGYLFQEGALFDFMDVYENLALPLREHGITDKNTIDKTIDDILMKVELGNVKSKFPRQLSGGMKKRVGLARAIILKPKLLLCDEPTSGLDPASSSAISKLILKMCRDLKTTTVVVTHDVNNFFEIADRIAILSNSKIVALGTSQELSRSHDTLVENFFLRSKN